MKSSKSSEVRRPHLTADFAYNKLILYYQPIGGLGEGQVVSTSAGNLPADYVFHAVGPVYNNNPRAENSLRLAVTNSLNKANALNCKSIAMPAISTGIFGYPKVR